ncbi:actin-like ATPase domain-containing protein [Penicillium coprophilum]|uniref:actin-like ATPase domain-containing protein n=1 Tax=Penicillium coprophilum TaxID=36646 RepID=UPI0023A05A40|nr:actin-like ATPase domain-containing protein [Penicillium coprophilum]KAJ5154781.1 actin-like ATPase domain-containing protein [Penicillium coprophilum]
MLSPRWGFDIEPDMRAYSLTKLVLDSSTKLAEFDELVLDQAVSLGNPHQDLYPDTRRPPVDVVADYLFLVLKFVWKRIQDIPDLPLHDMPVELQFTIPAIWSDQGHKLSTQAIDQAWTFKRPQDTLTITSEPEAAAEAMHVYLKNNGMLQNGDGILVCDCGSGTVVCRLVPNSYYNSKLYTKGAINHSLQGYHNITCYGLHQLQSKCGGAAIDRRLFDLMKNRLPQNVFEHLNHLIAPGSEFMGSFEHVKRSFGSTKAQGPFHLPLRVRRGRAAYGMSDFNMKTGMFTLVSEDVQTLFDPVIDNIIHLVNSQIEAADREYGSPVINKILLVGGLASSPCLQDAFRRNFEVSGRSLITLPPRESVMAVSTGSALQAMRAKFRSPRHYGVGSPLPRGRLNFQRMEIQREVEEIKWFIVKGKRYQEGLIYAHTNAVSYHLYHEHDAKVMVIPVYSCELSSPPYPAHAAQFNDLTVVGYIFADFSTLDLEACCHEWNPNARTVYRLNYSVGFNFDAENRALRFTVEALQVVIGTASIGLDF